MGFRRRGAVVAVSLSLLGPACARPPRPTAFPHPNQAADTALQALDRDLSAIFEEQASGRSTWGVLVQSTVSGVPLYELNASGLMMPGSNVKLFTIAAAAEMFGWDHRFETRLESSAPVEAGTLHGDLVVVGSGDPGIGERGQPRGILQSWARQLWDAGIRAVDGRIVGDDNRFDDEGLGPGWSWDDIPYGFAAPSGALEYNEDSVDLVIHAGAKPGDPVSVEVRPEGSDLVVENRLGTSAVGSAGSVALRRLPGSSALQVSGQVPAGAPAFVRTASVDNPTQFFVNALRLALIERGIRVTGAAVDIDAAAPPPDSSGARVLLSHRSPPLSDLAATMIGFSQNVYAESLLKALAAREGVGTTDHGRRMVREIMRTWGVYPETFLMVDGSGLSRYNYASPDALVRVLQHLHENPDHARAFLPTLPVAGEDGMLSGRLAGTAAQHNVRAKTGTLANVRAMSGYVSTRDGEVLVFSIIANNFIGPASAVDAATDRALVRLAEFTRKTEPRTRPN